MIRVLEGFAAIRIGRYWVGVTPLGYFETQRRTAERALQDAKAKHETEARTTGDER